MLTPILLLNMLTPTLLLLYRFHVSPVDVDPPIVERDRSCSIRGLLFDTLLPSADDSSSGRESLVLHRDVERLGTVGLERRRFSLEKSQPGLMRRRGSLVKSQPGLMRRGGRSYRCQAGLVGR